MLRRESRVAEKTGCNDAGDDAFDCRVFTANQGVDDANGSTEAKLLGGDLCGMSSKAASDDVGSPFKRLARGKLESGKASPDGASGERLGIVLIRLRNLRLHRVGEDCILNVLQRRGAANDTNETEAETGNVSERIFRTETQDLTSNEALRTGGKARAYCGTESGDYVGCSTNGSGLLF